MNGDNDRITYLDYNATTPVKPAVTAAMLRALEEGGNPSSIHAQGRKARARLEEAREAVAGLSGACSENVIFTSGGTEANNLGILGLARAQNVQTIFCSAIEHPSVREAAFSSGLDCREIAVTHQGQLDLTALDEALANCAGRPLLALMLANNETGVIQPLAQAAERIHAAGGWLHCDAVQAAGKIPLQLNELQADSLALSAHKLGGPQGVGALVLAEAADISARLQGGGQERGRRGGTENLPGITGFGEAAKLALNDLSVFAMLNKTRDAFEARLKKMSPGLVVFGEQSERLPNTSAFAVLGMPAETLLMALDLAGVAVSSGSACSSGKVGESRVLKAMGVDKELARCALRVSLGWASTQEDIDHFLAAFAGVRAYVPQAAFSVAR